MQGFKIFINGKKKPANVHCSHSAKYSVHLANLQLSASLALQLHLTSFSDTLWHPIISGVSKALGKEFYKGTDFRTSSVSLPLICPTRKAQRPNRPITLAADCVTVMYTLIFGECGDVRSTRWLPRKYKSACSLIPPHCNLFATLEFITLLFPSATCQYPCIHSEICRLWFEPIYPCAD